MLFSLFSITDDLFFLFLTLSFDKMLSNSPDFFLFEVGFA